MRTSGREVARWPSAMSLLGAKALALCALLLWADGARAADSVNDLALDLQMIPLDGQPAPPFTLPALDGKPVSLAEFKGQVVLLYFWASW